MKVNVREPRVVRRLFEPADFEALRRHVGDATPTASAQEHRGRAIVDEDGNDFLVAYARKLLPKARAVFESDTLVPSYSLCFRYEGATASLERHKDSHANSYSLGCCVEQKTPWPLWVEGRAYALRENEAIAFHGSHQEHWREAFPAPETNVVAMAFFNFVEPDHWFVTMGQRYVAVRRLIDRALREASCEEHRLFLSLLNEAGSPEEFYGLVRERFPSRDPLDQAFEWVEGLCGGENPLRLVLNRSMRRMARSLAEGKGVEQIAADVNGLRRSPAPRADVVKGVSELRSSALAMLFPRPGGRPWFEADDRCVSREPTLTSEFSIGPRGRKVYVLDDVIVARARSGIYSHFRTVPYRYTDVDSNKTAFARHLVHNVEPAEADRLPVVHAIHEMARRFLERRGHDVGPLQRIYVNFNLFGDYQFRHRDGRVWSALTFINDEWDPDWAGELLYYDEDDPRGALVGIVPEPGRTVIFDGEILHRGGVPSKYFLDARLSLAIKIQKGGPQGNEATVLPLSSMNSSLAAPSGPTERRTRSLPAVSFMLSKAPWSSVPRKTRGAPNLPSRSSASSSPLRRSRSSPFAAFQAATLGRIFVSG